MEYRTQALIITVRPDDIVELRGDPDWDKPDTLEIAQENVAAMIKAIGEKKRAMISYTPAMHISKEVLKYYSSSESTIGAVATALISESFGSKLMGDLFLKIVKKGSPVKIFSIKEEDKAIEWLLDCIEKAKG